MKSILRSVQIGNKRKFQLFFQTEYVKFYCRIYFDEKEEKEK